MRPVSFGQPPADPRMFQDWVAKGLQQVSRASNEANPNTVADDFTVTNFTITRTLDAGTATTADIANVLATFISDLQKRGSKRSG